MYQGWLEIDIKCVWCELFRNITELKLKCLVFLMWQVLTGHTGSVLCLQYDDKVIISGSSDSTVRVWDVATGEMVNTLIHHCEAVLHLRFCNGMMVTCSKVRYLPGRYSRTLVKQIVCSFKNNINFFRIDLLLSGI